MSALIASVALAVPFCLERYIPNAWLPVLRLWYQDNQELAVAQAQVSELASENARFRTRVLDIVREREQQGLVWSRRRC